jgi:hypothetical protein
VKDDAIGICSVSAKHSSPRRRRAQTLSFPLQIREVRAFNFTYRYLDDVISINNNRFTDFPPFIVSQMKMTVQEIRISDTGPCIANQLKDVNTIDRRSWYIKYHLF